MFVAKHVIEEFYNRELMMTLAKIVDVEPTQNQKTLPKLLMPEKAHDDDKVQAVQMWLETHFSDSITVTQLAKQHGMTVRTLTRHFKKATQSSPWAYLQKVRLEAAKNQLATQDKSASEIIWDIGYEDVSSFRRLFKTRTGMTMECYRNSVRQSYQVSGLG